MSVKIGWRVRFQGFGVFQFGFTSQAMVEVDSE